MNSIKFNDWQEMALKKDTEAIIKKLNSQEPIMYSLCWEIVIAIAAVIIDHLFDTNAISIHIWIICVILAVLPPAIVLIVKITKWCKSIKKAKSGIYDVKGFIDAFDNQICYWVMMCNSYCRLLSSIPSEQKSEIIFLYQEGCYYNNKSILALYKMKPVIDKVFSNNPELVTKNSLVSIYRLLSLLELMIKNQSELETHINSLNLKDNPSIEEQRKINQSFHKKIDTFISDLNDLFKTEFEWKIKDD